MDSIIHTLKNHGVGDIHGFKHLLLATQVARRIKRYFSVKYE